MRNIITFLSIYILVFTSCTVTHNRNPQLPIAINSLKYIGEHIIPFNHQFKGTTIGGLSGIDYDARKKLYYLICDDRSSINPARFYTAKINFTHAGFSNVEFVNVTTFLQPDGMPYPDRKKDPAHSPDPEALRYNPVTDNFVWTSEGERITGKENVLLNPAITTITKEGKYFDTFPLPAQMHMYTTEKGLRQNGVFEGLTFADNFKTMYVSVEEPLYEDGPRAGLRDTTALIRILKYDVATKKQLAQFAYNLEAIAHPSIPENEFKINGIPDIISVGNNKLLVIERSFSTGIAPCTIRIYLIDISKATNIAGVASLKKQPPVSVAYKKLLLNMDVLGIYTDNIEGVTFGPDLPNGHKTLIFVSDNNFSKDQKTQFLLFEVL
jgi:hypothetical protein